ncbi:hypothetical protein Pan97_28850 [Bremerella volcania]|uniref:DUF1559 domain-containing protein n=1 Tax=Bremerella volcania TaxID=2527984 RepID=A0A518C9D4_9BACT|nr:DUF1559 domain-containing protein [Bremerella volcania]QDU75843.1 hypothetical protein Pan97_28850 [Bremerella volcania]
MNDSNLLTLMQIPVTAFMCPSTAGPDLNDVKPVLLGSNNDLARSDYVVVNDKDFVDRRDPDGSFVCARYNAPHRFADITDGLTNTLFVGERCYQLGGEIMGAGVVYGTSSQKFNDGEEGLVYVAGSGRLPINLGPLSSTDFDHRQGFASNHPGGVNFLFGDGSVHFETETIDHNISAATNSMFEYLIVEVASGDNQFDFDVQADQQSYPPTR